MTGRLPKTLRRRSAVHAAFEAAMNSGAPIVDNAGHLTVVGQLEYDGPRCAGCAGCDTAVDRDGDTCTDCTPCARCDGDGCDWHLSPTNGAIEIDRACPDCTGTGRTPR